MNTKKTERENNQLVPFTFEDHAVRTVVIDGALWWLTKDVCDVLGIQNYRDAVSSFPKNEKGVVLTDTLGGKQEMLTVNEPGLYRLIFQSRKSEAEKFKAWVFGEVLPSIRRTGGYGGANELYPLFSACPEMTIQRVNKFAYLLSLEPPLANTDIATLMDVNPATITYWCKRLTPEAARKAVAHLGINAQGFALAAIPRHEKLPAKGAQNETK